MNIFILDTNINACARYHCDQHVVKMTLESVQIICTALYLHGKTAPYRPTHLQHTCVRWAAASRSNMAWLARLAHALNREFRYRFQKEVDHASIQILNQVDFSMLEDCGRTPFVQVVPECYRMEHDPVTAYRKYYCHEKAGFARWTR